MIKRYLFKGICLLGFSACQPLVEGPTPVAPDASDVASTAPTYLDGISAYRRMLKQLSPETPYTLQKIQGQWIDGQLMGQWQFYLDSPTQHLIYTAEALIQTQTLAKEHAKGSSEGIPESNTDSSAASSVAQGIDPFQLHPTDLFPVLLSRWYQLASVFPQQKLQAVYWTPHAGWQSGILSTEMENES